MTDVFRVLNEAIDIINRAKDSRMEADVTLEIDGLRLSVSETKNPGKYYLSGYYIPENGGDDGNSCL